MHFGKDAKLLALIMLFVGMLMLIPLGVSVHFDERQAIKKIQSLQEQMDSVAQT